jgi:hypothetical protein
MHERAQPMEIAGHEFWDRSGKAVWFDLQTPKGEKFFLASNDLEGKPRARYEVTRDQWSVHFNQSHDGSRFAGDGGDAKQVAKATDGQMDLAVHARGRRETVKAERLCGMGAHDYALEPNVRFSPDDRWVIFHAKLHGVGPGVWGGGREGQAVETPAFRASDENSHAGVKKTHLTCGRHRYIVIVKSCGGAGASPRMNRMVRSRIPVRFWRVF